MNYGDLNKRFIDFEYGKEIRKLRIALILGNDNPYIKAMEWFGGILQAATIHNVDDDPYIETVFMGNEHWIAYTISNYSSQNVKFKFNISVLGEIEDLFHIVVSIISMNRLVHMFLTVLTEIRPDDPVYNIFRKIPFVIESGYVFKYEDEIK